MRNNHIEHIDDRELDTEKLKDAWRRIGESDAVRSPVHPVDQPTTQQSHLVMLASQADLYLDTEEAASVAPADLVRDPVRSIAVQSTRLYLSGPGSARFVIGRSSVSGSVCRIINPNTGEIIAAHRSQGKEHSAMGTPVLV